MSDKLKIALAVVLFVTALAAPFGVWFFVTKESGLAWGIAAAAATFVLFFLLSVILLFRVKDYSWASASLPYVFGSLYTLLPDAILGSIDDSAMMGLGSVFTTALALRRNPRTPKWIFLLLFGSAAYAFFGGALPGPLDEAIVTGLSYLVYIYSSNKADQEHAASA